MYLWHMHSAQMLKPILNFRAEKKTNKLHYVKPTKSYSFCNDGT